MTVGQLESSDELSNVCIGEIHTGATERRNSLLLLIRYSLRAYHEGQQYDDFRGDHYITLGDFVNEDTAYIKDISENISVSADTAYHRSDIFYGF